jgi:hypothetical protein
MVRPTVDGGSSSSNSRRSSNSSSSSSSSGQATGMMTPCHRAARGYLMCKGPAAAGLVSHILQPGNWKRLQLRVAHSPGPGVLADKLANTRTRAPATC